MFLLLRHRKDTTNGLGWSHTQANSTADSDDSVLALALGRLAKVKRKLATERKSKQVLQQEIARERAILVALQKQVDREDARRARTKKKLHTARRELDDLRGELNEERRRHIGTHKRHYDERLQLHNKRMALLRMLQLRSLSTGRRCCVEWRAREELGDAERLRPERMVIEAVSMCLDDESAGLRESARTRAS